MIKKTIFAAAVAVMCVCASPMQAQFKLNTKKLTKAVKDVATDMASDVVANQASAKIVGWMDTNNTVMMEDSEYYKRLSSIVSDMVEVDGAAFNYKVYENPEINILSCADGSIRVYSGMMDALTDEELKAVIAVQIGHIVNKDTRDALFKVASEDNAAKASSAQLEKILSMSGDGLGTIVNELIQVPYSDDQNKNADKFAVSLLSKKGVSSSALVSALSKFAEMEANDASAEEDDTVEASGASKFNAVNSNNAIRASLLD
ncbi:hypothetical protein D0T53_12885 [Dysgonomonas sp. 216]|uniref:M48 family metalloprotease n=1 Tax=Dysgonomonas sp. 216 TaxID=2302934 RepID=UPI0013D8AA5B|nr:M48 family metalloprotease [Dysgonomonas sp. 216]NDW19795.1 hypothetical protein [Dysgonomonas sp. 216]